ncbi:ribokinase [Humibacter ginsenosidimutans]|uniref:Ribokinase n=1 Tax=Humibacter ginsenosidimutans TaxID=2599293 RepID=A0A5B8M5Y0_9MICO|nr:ribokinase [Humibacter ginsenosidimutans]QDZ14880.1 ribokinase [Humibacter ginsenosidimutans]
MTKGLHVGDRPRVTVLASLNLDLAVTTPRLPAEGETLLGSSLVSSRGGKGGNQAVALARLGVPTAVIGCLGDDDAGARYLEALVGEHLDVAHVRTAHGAPTGTALITVDGSGANTIVVVPGANALLGAADVTDASRTIAASRVVLAQLETPVAPTTRAFELARSHDVITVLNPAPSVDGLDELLALTDVVVPNEPEFAGLVGCTPNTDDELRHACARLFEHGVSWVVVTQGAAGCVVIGPESIHRVPALRADAVDTTAAGDAFVAGLVAVIAETQRLDEETIVAGARRGSAVAALSVRRRGAQTSLPTSSEVGAVLRDDAR